MIHETRSIRAFFLFLGAAMALILAPAPGTAPVRADEGGSGEGEAAHQQPADDGIEEDEAPPGLDQSIIKKVIDSHMPAIRYCYNKELRRHAGLSGTVVTRFTVGKKGTVTEAEIGRSTLNNKNVEQCMLEEIKGWVFPEPNKGVEVVVNYPFKFKSSGSNG